MPFCFTLIITLDNTNWRAGGPDGPCFQMKNVNFQRAAQKTEGRAGGLHKKEVRRAAEKAEAGCREKRAALRPALFRSPV